MYATRMDKFRLRLHEASLNIALVTDEDNIYYLTGDYDYLHMDFGRPTSLIVPCEGRTILVTPNMEMDMAEATAHVGRAQVGDSFIITEDGYEQITNHPNALESVIVQREDGV